MTLVSHDRPTEQPAAAAVADAQAGGVRQGDKLLMLAATAARMGVGLLTFVILARFLGPQPFGVIATAIAYTGFAAMISDFGFPTSALRRASADPERAGAIVADGIAVKATLILLVTLLAAPVAALVLPGRWLLVYAIVHVGSVAFSFADLVLVIARARRRFDIEARIVIASSVVLLLVVGGVAATTRDILATAIAFSGTRLVYLAVVLRVVDRLLGPIGRLRRGVPAMMATACESSTYALDNLLTNLSTQIDVLLFGALLAAHDMGVYQAGARLVQVIAPLAVALSTTYLPTLARAAAADDRATFRRSAGRLNVEFFVLAAAAAAGFDLVVPGVTTHLYGEKYAPLAHLWGGFAAFVALRLTASSFGIQLAALGHIRTRVAASVASIATMVVLAVLAVPHWGLAGTSRILAMASLPSTLILGLAVERSGTGGRFTLPCTLGAVLICVVTLFV